MQQQYRTNKRTLGLACLTLLSAAILTATGIHWTATSRISVRSLVVDQTDSRIAIGINTGHWATYRIEIRDAKSGEQRCDLGPWGPRLSHGTVIRWSSDGKKMGGVSYELNQTKSAWETSVVELDVSGPKAKVLNKWPITKPTQPIALAFDAEDRLVFVNHQPASTTSRPKLDVLKEGKVLNTIELGKDEQTSTSRHGDNGLSFRVYNAGYSTNPKPDVLMGMPELQAVTIHISPETGHVLGKRKNAYVMLDPVDSNLVYEYDLQTDATAPGFRVFEVDDPIHLVETIPTPAGTNPDTPISLSDHEYLFESYADETFQDSSTGDTFPSHLLIVDAKDDSHRRIKLPYKTRLRGSTRSGQAFLVNAWSKIIRLDLNTGRQTILVDYQRGTLACGIATLIGLPLLWIVFCYVGTRDISPNPFMDMTLLITSTTIMGVFWCAIGLKEVIPANPATLLAASGGMAVVLFTVAWAFHSDAFLRIGIPSLIAAFAGGVVVILLWSRGNTWHAFEETAAGAVLVGWQLFGLTVYRLSGGRLIRTDELRAADANAAQSGLKTQVSQVSILSVLCLIGACALLFAVLRFMVLDENLIQVVTRYSAWIVTLVGLAALLSIVALRCVVYIGRSWVSVLCYLAIAMLACVIHYFATIQLETSNVGWNPWVRALVVSGAGMMNWLAFAYCKRHFEQGARQVSSKERGCI